MRADDYVEVPFGIDRDNRAVVIIAAGHAEKGLVTERPGFVVVGGGIARGQAFQPVLLGKSLRPSLQVIVERLDA